MEKRKTFLQGAAVLGIAGLIIKALGAAFRIPLVNIIGPQGMAYYQMAYPIYVLFLTLSTAGIPTAISRMVAERNAVNQPREAHRVFRISFVLLLGIGLVSSALLYFGADTIMAQLGNERASWAMKAIAPALLFVPLMAAYRGYFQGMQNMKPTAVSQVVEQLFRVVAGLSLAIFLVPMGLEFAAAGASFGATAGAVGGLLCVAFIYFIQRKSIHQNMAHDHHQSLESAKSILLKICVIAIPITIGASIMPIMNGIDVAIVMSRLQETGYSEQAAEVLYGELSGMSGALINFPQVLTQAIAMSLVPAIAASFRRNEMRELQNNVSLGLRSAMIVGMPCALGMMTLAEPIMRLLYPAQASNAASASQCLFVLAIGVVFLSSVQTTTGILQGIGKQKIPVINMVYGAIAKIVITYVATGIPSINVKGAALGSIAAYAIAATLNIMAVKKHTGVRLDAIQIWIKPLAAAVTMSALVWVTHRILMGFAGNTLATLISVMVGAFTYGIMLFVTRAITMQELAMLPKGDKLVKVFGRFQRR